MFVCCLSLVAVLVLFEAPPHFSSVQWGVWGWARTPRIASKDENLVKGDWRREE